MPQDLSQAAEECFGLFGSLVSSPRLLQGYYLAGHRAFVPLVAGAVGLLQAPAPAHSDGRPAMGSLWAGICYIYIYTHMYRKKGGKQPNPVRDQQVFSAAKSAGGGCLK